MTEAYLSALELGYHEVTFAFDGLADGHVWKRPAAGLLSVGELAGHIAYWEAVKFASEGGDPEPDLICWGSRRRTIETCRAATKGR